MWRELDEVIHGVIIPCIIIGDFNAVYKSIDRVNGNPVSEAETQDFDKFILEATVIEAPTAGLFYFWNNKGVGQEKIASRIDKAFVNQL